MKINKYKQINKYMQIYIYIYILLYLIYLIPVESSSIPAGIQLFQWNPVSFWWIPAEFGHSCRNVRGIEKYWIQFITSNITTTLTDIIIWDIFVTYWSAEEA